MLAPRQTATTPSPATTRCGRALARAPAAAGRHAASRRRPLTRTAASDTDAAPTAAVAASNGASSNGASTTTTAPVAAAAAPTPVVPPAQQQQQQQQQLLPAAVASLKLQLLAAAAGLDRGALATPAQHAAIGSLIASLEGSGAGAAAPCLGSPAPAEGRWQLVYTNKEVFRASPFFAAFQDGLVRDKATAEAIFAFTDAIPGAVVGPALQALSLSGSGTLISEVDLAVWPGLDGTVVTSSRAAALSPTRLALDVQSTRVANSGRSALLGPLLGRALEGVSVPVEALTGAVAGPGATRVLYDLTFVDEGLRVTRCGDQVLVHTRV